jgi:gamma-glutamyltranspeptidase / glutathione hydrolase
MPRPKLAVAAGNALGAEAGAVVARAGGNAVDACLAAAVMAWVAEPFYASMSGSGFIAVRSPGGDVGVVDGNNSMPENAPERLGQGTRRVFLDYSNGVYTSIGAGAVGTPGVLSAVHRAWRDHGRIEWGALFDPAIQAARAGIPLPRPSSYYLSLTWGPIWSGDETAASLFGRGGTPLGEGDLLVQQELAEVLEEVAALGPEVLHSGELAAELIDHIVAAGGFMTLEDLSTYQAVARSPISASAVGWLIESNPPPASGGAVLTALLSSIEEDGLQDPVHRLRTFVRAEREALKRGEYHGEPGDVGVGKGVAKAQQRTGPRSASTTHTSAADADGLACSFTQSNGYGAGLVVHGMLLNNTLGEEEINPHGIHRLTGGTRCHSNMAPTIATGPDLVVALGSPGAERIAGAIAQTIIALAAHNNDLRQAVGAPRAHLAAMRDGELLCFEPGIPGFALKDYKQRPFRELHQFFGGVQAASVDSQGQVDAVHDPRRAGASSLV